MDPNNEPTPHTEGSQPAREGEPPIQQPRESQRDPEAANLSPEETSTATAMEVEPGANEEDEPFPLEQSDSGAEEDEDDDLSSSDEAKEIRRRREERANPALTSSPDLPAMGATAPTAEEIYLRKKAKNQAKTKKRKEEKRARKAEASASAGVPDSTRMPPPSRPNLGSKRPMTSPSTPSPTAKAGKAEGAIAVAGPSSRTPRAGTSQPGRGKGGIPRPLPLKVVGRPNPKTP